MKARRFGLLFWVLKEQYRASPLFFIWKFVYALYNGAASLVYVYLTANLVSSITRVALSGSNPGTVYRFFVFILIYEVLDSLIRAVDSPLQTRFNQQMTNRFDSMLMNKLYELSQEQFEEEEFNTAVSRARDAISGLQNSANEVTWALESSVRFIGSVGAIIVVSPLVGLAIALLTIPSTLVSARENRLQEALYKQNDSLERSVWRTRWSLFYADQMLEIRLTNGFKSLFKFWSNNKQRLDKSYYDLDRRVAWLRFASAVSQPIVLLSALVYFFKKLVAGALSLERFLILRGLLEQALNSAQSLATSFKRLDNIFINLSNFMLVNSAVPAIKNGTKIVCRPLTIEFKNVSFRYPAADKKTIDNISFKIVPGSKLALVGENGAGKTTLIKLLMRQYLPTEGTITVNGTDIKEVDILSYYNELSVLTQSFFMLSHLSIRQNLTLGLEKSDQKMLDRAVELAGATEFISRLKNKLDQKMDSSFEDGTNLSGGQLQRLGVARAILHDGDLMILDEPTSAIDAKAEYTIFNNIYKEHQGRTTLIISHRFSTVRKADGIIVMENGKITEYGSHEELIKHSGLYKEMFDLQAEGYK